MLQSLIILQMMMNVTKFKKIKSLNIFKKIKYLKKCKHINRTYNMYKWHETAQCRT